MSELNIQKPITHRHDRLTRYIGPIAASVAAVAVGVGASTAHATSERQHAVIGIESEIPPVPIISAERLKILEQEATRKLTTGIPYYPGNVYIDIPRQKEVVDIHRPIMVYTGKPTDEKSLVKSFGDPNLWLPGTVKQDGKGVTTVHLYNRGRKGLYKGSRTVFMIFGSGPSEDGKGTKVDWRIEQPFTGPEIPLVKFSTEGSHTKGLNIYKPLDPSGKEIVFIPGLHRTVGTGGAIKSSEPTTHLMYEAMQKILEEPRFRP